MPGFTESSITLNFPDANFFRFSDCLPYALLSANYFKEMDACWYDAEANIYWLFELKDYSLATLSSADTINTKAWDMVKKAVDSICMFLANKHGYVYGLNFNAYFPASPNGATQFKFITVVHCLPAQAPDIQLINNAFRNRFKSYAVLFGINHYAVMEHSIAMRVIPNNMVQ